MFTFLKLNKGFVIEKLSTFKTFKALDNNDHTSAIADHINTTEHPNVKAKNHYHYKIKETFLIQYLKPAFNANVSREKLML